MKKYTMEKVLHEIIRDNPTADRINVMYERGLITMAEAFRLLASMIETMK